MRDDIFRSTSASPPSPPSQKLVPVAPPSTRPEYKHRPSYAYIADKVEVKGSRQDKIRFRVLGFKGFLFDEDLTSAANHTPPESITYDKMRDHLHGQIRKGLHLCSEMREEDIARVDSTSSDLFVQDGAMCSAYATWQFLYSALWEHLDDWTRTFLNSLIQYQDSLRLAPQRLPLRFVRTKILEARPDIMMTYYADSDDNKERRELMADVRQLTADLADEEDSEKREMLTTKNTQIQKLDREWEESVKAVPWYSSFTRLLRAHLTCLTDGPALTSPDPGDNPLEPNLQLQSGLNILSLPIDELVETKDDTWNIVVSTVRKFEDHFHHEDKGIVRGCCVRCVLADAPQYDHFITYINGTWYDNGGGGAKTKEFTDLRHYQFGGTIDDLHIIIFQR
jgi:hypothetical protein